MPLEVRRQAVGRFVTARAVLLQALHHDPVQVAPELVHAASSASAERRLAVVVSSSPRSVASRVLGRTGSFSRIVRRISSMPERHQFLRIERRAAGQQFVEQHAQAVDVAARVNVQPAHLRLLRTHVGRRADELLQLREDRLVRQPPFGGLGDAEINHLRHRHAVVQRDEDVRRLDVAVDDALLMRVLDGLADLDEQLEPLARWRACSGRSTR